VRGAGGAGGGVGRTFIDATVPCGLRSTAARSFDLSAR
jgi:hypothetical protein